MGIPSITVERLAREAVTSLAPGELKVFDSVARPYLDDPGGMARAIGASEDDPLSSGLSTVVALLTPAAVLVATTVLTTFAEHVTHDLYGSSMKRLSRLMRRKRRAGTVAASQVQALTPDQLAQ